MAWSVYCRTVAEAVLPTPGLILFCGAAIGFEVSAACQDLIGRPRSSALVLRTRHAGCRPSERIHPEAEFWSVAA
jgi:hypothetical protein